MATVAKNTRSTPITISVSSAGPFDLGFRLFDTDAVRVYVNGVRNDDWTLTATFTNGFTDAATVTFDTAVTAPADIVIEAALVPWREEDLVNGDINLVSRINNEMARIWSALAELRRDADRSIRSFDAIEPANGIDLETIAEAESHATAAATSATAAAASAAAAAAAENSLLEWKGAWATATAYSPSDLAYEGGSTYVCVSSHTSGTFATDLAAGKWQTFAQKGAAGAGTGDVLAANNGSEFPAPGTVRANLSLFGALLTPETGADALSRVAANPRGMFFVAGTGMTNMPTGGAANDVFWGKGLDADNCTAFWVLQNGTIFTNTRVAGTWGGWIAQAKESFVTAAIAAQQQLLHVQDRKTVGTNGGTFTAGSYLTRTLNDVRWNSITGASVASNQITLPAGTYDIEAECPAYAVNRHKAQLYNVTDAQGQVIGTAAFAHQPSYGHTVSLIRGRLTIASSKVFEIRHRCETTFANSGLGLASNWTFEEVYTDVRIRKIQ